MTDTTREPLTEARSACRSYGARAASRLAGRGAALALVFFAAAVPAQDAPGLADRAAGRSEEFREGSLDRDPASVFFIQRSKNRNEIHYRIALDADCRPAGAQPVGNYWLRLEEGPNVAKPLTFFQQRGYGIKEQEVSGDRVRVVLRALPQRPITFVASRAAAGCAAEATLDIGGRPARLERIYVSAVDGTLRPDVKYIELFARRDGGAPVTERLEP